MGRGRLNLNIEPLQTKCPDSRLNLPKVNIHNTCYVSVSSADVLFSNLFRLNEIGCNQLEIVIFKLLFLSSMHNTLYFSFYHANSKAML